MTTPLQWLVGAAMLLAFRVGVAQSPMTPSDEVGRTAAWRVAVRDVGAAEARVRAALQAQGGFVSGRTLRHPEGPVTLDLRVSATALDSFLAEMRTLGTVLVEETTARDPTPEFARVNGLLAALDASERNLIEQMSFLAPDEPLTLDLHREVAAVRSERAAALARRTMLDERVRYAVVRLTLVPEAALRAPSLAEEIQAALIKPWTDPLGAARQVLAVGLGILVPYVGGLALVIWAGVWTARRRRHDHRTP